MKLQSLKLYNTKYRSLGHFEQAFPKHKALKGRIDPIALVGLNGSGKSNFLELLADIFFEMEKFFLHTYKLYKEDSPKYFAYANKEEEPVFFEICYKIKKNKKEYEVKIIRKENNKDEPYIFVKKQIEGSLFGEPDYERITDINEARTYMPLLIAYTSGLNDLLTMPFIDMQDYYAQQVAKEALSGKKSDENIPAPNLFLLNYDSNAAIVVANFLLATDKKKKVFEETLRIKRMNSFRIVIRLNKLYGNKKVEMTEELIQYVQKLQECASLSDIKLNKENGNEYVLDFIVNQATIELFKEKFGNPKKIFEALTKLNLLNSLCIQKSHRATLRTKREKGQLLKFPQVASLDKIFSIENIELVLTEPIVRTQYEKISDGEHQFIHIIGGILLFDELNPERDLLYLLDEPDTHFNPLWRSDFFYQLDKVLENGNIECVLTTHSPFILSDVHGYNVFKFSRNGADVSFERVEKETYGTAFHHILTDIFHTEGDKYKNFNNNIAKQSYLLIENLHNQIDEIQTIDEWQEKSPTILRDIRMLGESMERLYLLKSYNDKEISLNPQS